MGLRPIYEEPIGGPYKQFWSAALIGDVSFGREFVYVTSEGKRADYHAVVMLSCDAEPISFTTLSSDPYQRRNTPQAVEEIVRKMACDSGNEGVAPHVLSATRRPTGLVEIRSEGDQAQGDYEFWLGSLIDELPDGRLLIYYLASGQRGAYQTLLRYDCEHPQYTERLIEGGLKDADLGGEGIDWVAAQNYQGPNGLPVELETWPDWFCE